MSALRGRPGATVIEADVLAPGVLEEAVEGCDWVFHMQANADVRHGLDHPGRDLEQNTIATARVLEAMRRSQYSAITRPRPAVAPLSAPMTGFGMVGK